MNSCWLCCSRPAWGPWKITPTPQAGGTQLTFWEQKGQTLLGFSSQLGNEAVLNCCSSQEHHPCCLEESEVSNRIVSLEIYWWCLFFLFFFFYSTLCSLHTNLLVANLQGCKLASHQPRTSVTIPFFLRLLSLMVLRLYHLLHPLPAAVSNSPPVTQCQPLQAAVALWFCAFQGTAL